MTRSTKPQKLPKGQRKPANTNFVITDRDLEILAVIGRYRYLRTGQISKLIFPENKTLQSARRRLKYLFHHGYIGRIQPLVQQGSGDSEIAYFLEKSGRELLAADDLPRYSLKNSVKPVFLQHALAVSEFRMNLELGLQVFPKISLQRIVADFELKTHTENAIGKRRYRLFDELQDPISKRKIVVYPDILFIMKAESASGKVFQRLFFVEIDRGTEGLNTIRDKLTGYYLYQREAVFKKFGEFADFRILIQTNSRKRADNISAIANDFREHLSVWVSEDEAVNAETIVSGLIWNDGSDERKSVLK